MRFVDLDLGQASAEAESGNPQLCAYLRDAFIDSQASIKKIQEGASFLILGEKGTGKSAIAQHLRLLSESDPMLRVTVLDWPHLRESAFSADLTSTRQRDQPAWSIALLAHVFQSLSKDCSLEDQPSLLAALEILRSCGVLPEQHLAAPTRTLAKVDFKLLGSVALDRPEKPRLTPLVLEDLIRIACDVSRETKHLIVIDDLDTAYKYGGNNLEALDQMVTEAKNLNQRFLQASASIRLVMLCRTNVFELLPNPNKNKIKQDSAIVLDWYVSPTKRASESPLFKLVNSRATLAAGGPVDVIARFFEQYVGSKPMHEFLLQKTRQTPRDLLMLLKWIRHAASDQPTASVSYPQLLAGFDLYSKEYFYGEIIDTLEGAVDSQALQRSLKALRSLTAKSFRFSSWLGRAKELGVAEADVKSVAEAMFECSAIASQRQATPVAGKETVLVEHWRYRNRHSALELRPDGFMIVHRGLWEAFDLH